MKTVYDLDKLKKPLEEYKIQSNSDLLSQEKEIHSTITKDNNDDRVLLFHSDIRTGTKWAIAHVLRGNAEVDYIHINDGKIVGIGIKTTVDLLSYKSKTRSAKNVCNCFSIP